jgi:prepilin-type N-terminal cleavage/methylation domain-containing protein
MMMHTMTQTQEQAQSGFSLLETLLALAIMSVASLALFQSTTTLLRLSDRTVNAALKAQDVAVMQKSFSELVKGLVPAWSNKKEGHFIGTSGYFSGLTRAPLHTLKIGIAPFTLKLETGVDTASLVYQSEDTQWVLKSLRANEAKFSYLGEDNRWRSSWPPAQTPDASDFGDGRFYDPPTFPLAIRLWAEDSRTGKHLVWIAEVADRTELPLLEGE